MLNVCCYCMIRLPNSVLGSSTYYSSFKKCPCVYMCVDAGREKETAAIEGSSGQSQEERGTSCAAQHVAESAKSGSAAEAGEGEIGSENGQGEAG